MRQTSPYRCELCGEIETVKPVEIDHNHKTGKRRGLLCRPCNIRLAWYERGYLRTLKLEWLEQALTYLKEYN